MFRSLLKLPLIVVVTACASAPPVAPPPVTTPAPTVTVPVQPRPLTPPAPALRVADRVALAGTELGSMWTFENAPLKYWQQQYGFSATKEWLDNVRLSSVRYGDYCSASFVSPNGLVMTNHHCARECVEANSQDGTDHVVAGFYAATRNKEKVCPGLFLDQLVGITNVTQQVQAAPRGATDTETTRNQASTIERIQADCETQTRLTCQVVSLYHGGQYQLYKYKRYATVKLVFAPELQAGFFGGDADNFTYPRYALDVSFVRAYDESGNAPAQTPNYFKWKSEGARVDELVFVTGSPGSTSRQIPVSRVMYERDFRHPFLIQYLRAQRDLLKTVAAQSPQAQMQVRENLFEIENSLKAYEGQYTGLQDSLLLGQKIRWERELRRRVDAEVTLRAQYGDVWDKLDDLQVRKMRISPVLNLSNAQWLSAPQLLYASELLRYLTWKDKPESARPDDLRGEAWPQLEQMLKTPASPNPMIAEALLTSHIAMAARWLGTSDSLRTSMLHAGETPETAARRIIQTSRIVDASYRQQLISGGLAAVEASQDPAVRIARVMLHGRDALQQEWDVVTAAETVQQERMARALFGGFGTDIPPDATFTLRISDGVVKGYPYNGTLAPAFTTFYGIFGRSAEFRNEMPFTLPATYGARRAAMDMSKPLNFVTTNDITGGNSGSPMIDRDARVVGLAFDSNIEALPNEFLYRNQAGRTVGVSSAGITEALRNIYRATALLNELTGTK